MHPKPVFSLIDEPWIPVVDPSGHTETIGLRRALVDAHRFAEIIGEAPVITLALRRLLLALAHAVVGPASIDAWTRLWDQRQFPAGPINEYLDQRAHRFDLFGATPFHQCPELDATQAKPAYLLRWVQANNATLFDHAHTGRPERLAPAAAARWLLAQQTFDVGGLKTASGGGRESAEHAPLAGSVVVHPVGTTVFETLMLNLVRLDPQHDRPFPAAGTGSPVWDRDPPPPEPTARTPDGYLDWLTWPARRIRLLRDDEDMVAKVIITPGDRLSADTARERLEQYVAFTARSPKKGTPAQWQAVRLSPARAVWRDYADLLRPSEPATRQRPPVLDWLQDLRQTGAPVPSHFDLEAGGFATSQSKILLWRLERHRVPARILADTRLIEFLTDAVTLAHDIREKIGASLRWKYPRNGTAPDPGEVPPHGTAAIGRAETSYWSSAGQGFDALLAGLDHEPIEAGRRWLEHLTRSAWDAVAPLLRNGDARQLARASLIEQRLRRGLAEAESRYRDALDALTDEESP